MSEHPNFDRILLVLDIDETLVYGTEEPLERDADFTVGPYHLYRRPYLDEFLQICSEHFELAVWSSASDNYVDSVVQNIIPASIKLNFVWGRSRASLRRLIRPGEPMADTWDHRHYRKQLAKVKRLGWPLERMLIVDDTPEKCMENYGNAIYPRAFVGDLEDRELELLAEYLVGLSSAENVRVLEKRRWRQSVK